MDFDSIPDESAAAPASAQPMIPASTSIGQAPSFDEMQDDSTRFGTPGQKAATIAEGALQGIIGPLAPVVEKGLAIPEEDIRGRALAHPVLKGIGETGGLAAGIFTGTGEGALLEAVGKTAPELVGLGGASTTAAKIGSAAVRSAAEMAVLQGSDETAKMIVHDPDTSAQSAMANVGLAAVLGGASGAFITGAVSPLWKATVGDKLESGLSFLTDKLGGVEGKADLPSTQLIARSGLETPIELQGIIEENPIARKMALDLSQDDTSRAGRAFQEMQDNYKQQASDRVVETLGREPSIISDLPDIDKAAIGRGQAESLISELNDRYAPIKQDYEKIEQEFKNAPMLDAHKQYAADKIAEMVTGLSKTPVTNKASLSFLQGVMEDLKGQESASTLKQFITDIRNTNPWGSDTYDTAKAVRSILSNVQKNVVSDAIMSSGKSEAEALEKLKFYQDLQQRYSQHMSLLDNLNEHLHVGRYDGPGSFINALKDMSISHPESVVNRLSGKTNANILELLQDFPSTLDKVKQYHIDNLIDGAIKGAKGEYELNTSKLLRDLDKLPPTIKNTIASPEQYDRINAINQILEKFKDPRYNYSNTGRTVISKILSMTALSPLAFLMEGGLKGGIAGLLFHLGLAEAGPALKMAGLKWLGSSQAIDAPALKTAAQYLGNVYKGQNVMANAVASVFRTGGQVLSASQMPNKADKDKLDNYVDKVQENPTLLMRLTENGNVGHYLPEHQSPLTQATLRPLQYCAQIKPQSYRPSPLDAEVKPSSVQMDRYNRCLDIAQQPISILQHIKDGTLQANDVQDIRAMYPSVYQDLSQKLTNAMINAHNEGRHIPYNTKVGLSLFLGQPIDTSISSQSIMSAQPKPIVPSMAPAQQGRNKKNTSKLGKINSSFLTPLQGAEKDKTER